MITFGRPDNNKHFLTAKRLNKSIMATELFRKPAALVELDGSLANSQTSLIGPYPQPF
jgi:hypothetical protein